MDHVYLVRGSEDGNLGIFASLDHAMDEAFEYVGKGATVQTGTGAAAKGSSGLRVRRATRDLVASIVRTDQVVTISGRFGAEATIDLYPIR